MRLATLAVTVLLAWALTVHNTARASIFWPPPVFGAPSTARIVPEASYRFDEDCPAGAYMSTRNIHMIPEPSIRMRIPETHRIALGTGVTVAVLDTGVPAAASARVNLTQGGDLLGTAPVCSLHGEIMSTVIGGFGNPSDGFSGIAPASHIISYRVFDPAGRAQIYGAQPTEEMLRVTQRNMEKALVDSVNRGAKIIVTGGSLCVDHPRELDSMFLPTLHWVKQHGVLLFAPAGGVQIGNCIMGTNVNMSDVQPFQGTTRYPPLRLPMIPLPAADSQDVIAVTGRTNHGTLTADTIPGPWVSLTALVENTVAAHYYANIHSMGLVTVTTVDGKTFTPISDSGVAAAMVAGVAALLWSTNPRLSAQQIETILFRSATPAGSRVNTSTGYGTIDPYAAVTYTLPLAPILDKHSDNTPVKDPPPPVKPDYHPLYIALTAAGGTIAVLLSVLYVIVFRRQRVKQ